MRSGVKQKLKKARRWLKNLSGPCGIILLYHRVAESAPDPYSLCVTPRHFAEHLEVIRQLGHPARLQQMTTDWRAGKRTRRHIAITFDDGYADNLLNAKPMLEKYDVPATVFLTAEYIGSSLAFWWDELVRLFLSPGTLPERLQLNIQGNHYEWDLGVSACYTADQFSLHAGWNIYVSEESDPTPRHQCFRAIWARLKPLPFIEQQKLLGELAEWAGVKQMGRPTPGPLAFEEVHQLVAGGLVEAGAHTKTHPELSRLPAVTQREEIVEGKTMLENLLGRPIDQFAYPYGTYEAETVKIVREAGFASACSVNFDAVWPNPDLFQLPRITVEDCNGDEFEKLLKQVLN